jgi:aspartokinase
MTIPPHWGAAEVITRLRLRFSFDATSLNMDGCKCMMTADPRWVQYRLLTAYRPEAMELSHFGAKVVYPPPFNPVRQRKFLHGLKHICSSDTGTTITVPLNRGDIVIGIWSINIALLSLEAVGWLAFSFSKRCLKRWGKKYLWCLSRRVHQNRPSVWLSLQAMRWKQTGVDKTFETEIAQSELNLKSWDRTSVIALVLIKWKATPVW